MEHFIPFIVFSLSSSITPGPNNIMLMTSGVNFGIKRSLPHLFGVVLGFAAFILIVGLGLGVVFQQFAYFHQIISVLGAIYLLYLAWKIATANGKLETKVQAPISFLQACIFQWVNPKAWVMGVGAISAYTEVGENTYLEVMIIALTYLVMVLPTSGTWLVCGTQLKRFLKQEHHLRNFNYCMGALLALSVILIFIE